MINVFRWGVVALGVIGAGMNSFGVRASFLVWIVANSGMVALNCRAKKWPEVVLFSIYLITSVIGWVQWSGRLS